MACLTSEQRKSPNRSPRPAWFEGEVEARGGILRVRGRLCRDHWVIAAFKKDYPLGQPITEQIADDMVTELNRQQPGETEWLRARVPAPFNLVKQAG